MGGRFETDSIVLHGGSAGGDVGNCVCSSPGTNEHARTIPRGTVGWGLDDVSLLSQDPQQVSPTTDEKSSVPDAPTPKINPADPNIPMTKKVNNPREFWGSSQITVRSAPTRFASAEFQEKILAGDGGYVRLLRFHFRGRAGGNFDGQQIAAVLWARRCRLRPYYWHIFVDGGIENYMTEAIVPAVTKEDPRYYTLGKGGFIKRTGYAVSRLLITKTDAGRNTFNISEIVGAGVARASAMRITQHNPTPG